jgi:N-acetylneuraminate synthase
MVPISSPCDASAVAFLEGLDAPCNKIASFENTDLPLIRVVAATGKPMIISTGMATVSEMDQAVRCARDAGCRDLVLLKCTSTYPATPENSNIRTIPHLRALFDCEVGLSDHTPGVGAAVAAVAHGATVVEKHFTLARADGGVDSAFSLEPAEMRQLVIETERAWRSLGRIAYGPAEAEKRSLQFRRSIYVVRPIAAGEEFTRDNLRVIRPGFGLPPAVLEQVLGRTATRDLARGTALRWNLL